jgi:hypothetical protein
LNKCDGYYEGQDLEQLRSAMAAAMGAPTSEAISPEGFRVFGWEGRGLNTYLTMNDRGVKVTTSLPATSDPMFPVAADAGPADAGVKASVLGKRGGSDAGPLYAPR